MENEKNLQAEGTPMPLASTTTISTNTHWDLSKSPYTVNGTLQINAGVTLTIASGVTVKLGTGTNKGSISVKGTLTADNVTFTSDDGVKYWSGFVVASTGNLNLNRTTIKYCSSTAIANSGNLTLTNSNISNCTSYGVSLSVSAANSKVNLSNNQITTTGAIGVTVTSLKNTAFTFTKNTITNSKSALSMNLTNYLPTSVSGGLQGNTFNGPVVLFGTLQTNFTIPEGTFQLSNVLTVAANKTLTISPGAKIVATSATPSISVSGILNAKGTKAKHIIFTNTGDPEMGGKTPIYWKGFVISKTGNVNLDYAEVRYASTQAISVSGSLHCTNSEISNSKSNGILISSTTSATEIQLENNNFSDIKNMGLSINSMLGKFTFKKNFFAFTGKDAMYINLTNYKPVSVNGTLAENDFYNAIKLSGTFMVDFKLPRKFYNYTGILTVSTGKTVTLEPGATLKAETAASEIVVDGTMIVNGEANDTVIFTHTADPEFRGTGTPGWLGISVSSTGKAIMNYPDIRYTTKNGVKTEGELSLIGAEIHEATGNGIVLSTSNKNITLKENTVKAKTGLLLSKMQNGKLTMKDNVFTDATEYAADVNLTYFKPLEIDGAVDNNVVFGKVRLTGTVQRNMKFLNSAYLQNLTIPEGVMVTVGWNNTYKVTGRIIVNGTLYAVGDEGTSVTFTGKTDPLLDGGTAARWDGFLIGKTGLLVMDKGTIRNAGIKPSTGEVTYPISCEGKLNYTNSTIENAETNAIRISSNFYPLLQNMTFRNIKQGVYWLQNVNNSRMTIKAVNQNWGSPDGPNVDGAAVATTGGKITKGIQYIPYVTGSQTGTNPLQLQISYPSETIENDNTTLKVTVQGGERSSYYAEILCSADNATWYSKGSVTVPMTNRTGITKIQYPIYETGTLYTKAVLYDSRGGSQILESNLLINDIDVWYYISIRDKQGVTTDLTVSVADTTGKMVAVTKADKEEDWKEYEFYDGVWKDTNKRYKKRPYREIPSKNELRLYRKLAIAEKDLNFILDANHFTYLNDKGIFVSKQDYWQKTFPVSGLTDILSQQPGMVIDWEPIPFQYNNKKYLFSIWKGQYFALTGGEAALYEASSGADSYTPSSLGGMKIKLTLAKGTTEIFSQEENSSWITVYKAGEHNVKSGLKMTTSITFPDAGMSSAFSAALQQKKYQPTVSGNTITFVLGTPKYQNSALLKESSVLWSAVQKILCDKFAAFVPATTRAISDIKSKYSEFALIVASKIFYYDKVTQGEYSMTYNLATNENWIYCNHPEILTDDVIQNRCLNRATVNAGTGEIFYSYNAEKIVSSFNFGIYVTTTSTTPVTFQVLNYGHTDSSKSGAWTDLPINPWKDFFTKAVDGEKEYIISNTAPKWIKPVVIPENKLFTGSLRYYANGPVTISVYVYRNQNTITGTEPLCDYPYEPEKFKGLEHFNDDDDVKAAFPGQSAEFIAEKIKDHNNLKKCKVYSGVGQGFYLNANPVVIYLSQILNHNGVYFTTNSRDIQKNNVNLGKDNARNEMIQITLAHKDKNGNSLCAKIGDRFDGALHNVGNWGVHYQIPVTLINDLTDTEMKELGQETFEIQYAFAYDGDLINRYPIIQFVQENTDNTKQINVWGKIIEENPTPFTGKTFTLSKTVKQVQFNYQYIFGANSTEPMKHLFHIKE